jgi:hypothetical protein
MKTKVMKETKISGFHGDSGLLWILSLGDGILQV